MKRFLETYDGRPFDLIVVGGGISGAAVAYDAASRGLSVALVEKQDFGCATSAATSKLRADKPLAQPLDADGEILAQVVYAIREEMALTLKDVFFRRTGLGTLGDPGDDVVNKTAELATVELGWDEDRKDKEIQQVKQTMQVPA